MHMQVWHTNKKCTCTCACFHTWIIMPLHPALQTKVQFYYPTIVSSSSTCQYNKLDTRFYDAIQQTANLKNALIRWFVTKLFEIQKPKSETSINLLFNTETCLNTLCKRESQIRKPAYVTHAWIGGNGFA